MVAWWHGGMVAWGHGGENTVACVRACVRACTAVFATFHYCEYPDIGFPLIKSALNFSLIWLV